MRILVFIAAIVVLVAIFSTQNSQPVALSFLFWKFQASLAIVVFISALAGVIIGILASFFIRISKKRNETIKKGPEGSAHETSERDTLR